MKTLLTLATLFLLTGCLEPSPEEAKPADAQALVDSMVFVKGKSGLCFGVTTTARMSTNATIAFSNQIVQVPCTSVGL